MTNFWRSEFDLMKRCSFSLKIPSNVFVEMPKSNQFMIFSRQHIRIWFYTCPYRGQLKIQSNISMLLWIVQNPIQCVGKSISLICIFEFGRFLCVCCAIPSGPDPSLYLLLCGETGLHSGLHFINSGPVRIIFIRIWVLYTRIGLNAGNEGRMS